MTEETRYVLREDATVQLVPQLNAYKVNIGGDCWIIPQQALGQLLASNTDPADIATTKGNEPKKRTSVISEKTAEEFQSVWNKTPNKHTVASKLNLSVNSVATYYYAAKKHGFYLKGKL